MRTALNFRERKRDSSSLVYVLHYVLLFKLQKHCARSILYSPRDAPSYDNFQKPKWLPVDQLFKLNKLGLLKKVIDGRAPENLITTSDSLRFEHKFSTRTKTFYRLPKPRTEAVRRTFFYSTIKELNALNLELTISFSLMKTTLTNSVTSNYTVDNFKVKKLILIFKNDVLFYIIVDWLHFLTNVFISVFDTSQFLNL